MILRPLEIILHDFLLWHIFHGFRTNVDSTLQRNISKQIIKEKTQDFDYDLGHNPNSTFYDLSWDTLCPGVDSELLIRPSQAGD